MKERSKGVTIFAALTIFLASWFEIVIVFALIAVKVNNAYFTSIGSAIVGDIASFTTIFPLQGAGEKVLIKTVLMSRIIPFIILLIPLFAAIGLLKLKNWARITLIAINGALFIFLFLRFPSWFYNMVEWFKDPPEAMVHIYITFLVVLSLRFLIAFLYSASFLIFFTRPKVKEQF